MKTKKSRHAPAQPQKENRGGWCLLFAVYAPFTRPLRSVYARVRSVCAPCALRVRSVGAPCALRVRLCLHQGSFCLHRGSFGLHQVSCGLHQGHLRFTSWLPAVYTRPSCVGCSWVWALAVITRGRLSLRVIARCWFVVFVFDCFRVCLMTARFREADHFFRDHDHYLYTN